jgi:hypothetical protein
MRADSQQSLGDLIRAWRVLDPKDGLTRQTIAKMLGLAPPPPDDRPEMAMDEPMAGTSPATGLLTDQQTSELPPTEHPEPTPRPADEAVPFTLARSGPAVPTRPDWLKNIGASLPKPDESSGREPATPDPLFRPELTRSILSTVLATLAHQGPVDVEAVIEAISRAQVLRTVPRLPAPTLARGVQLLVDWGEAMVPFKADVKSIETNIRLVAGDSSLDVLRFAACPGRGVGPGPKRTWRNYFDTYTPPAGTLVICVSDLGIGRPPDPLMQAGLDEWLDFARQIQRADCPLVALVPYGPSRWPPELARMINIVHWTQMTNAARIGRVLHRKLEEISR